MNNEMLLVVFVGMTAFALLVQAIVLLVAFLTMRKTIASMQSDIQDLRTSAMPILEKSRETLEKVAPKIESIAADVADLTRRLKEQGVEFQAVATETLNRVHRQTLRVDNMFTDLFDSVERTSNVVADSMSKPVRQISAILAGAKAFLTVLATGRRPEKQAEVVADQDMFV